jgi:hypothetical protein
MYFIWKYIKIIWKYIKQINFKVKKVKFFQKNKIKCKNNHALAI